MSSHFYVCCAGLHQPLYIVSNILGVLVFGQITCHSNILLGGAALIRRPLVALSGLVSSYVIRKIGDLRTVCVSLFLYGSSFLALSFTRIAWLVLVVDIFQAAANGICYCAFTVLFYKASSKENSSMILGRFYTFLSETEGETRPQATSQFLYYTLKIADILIRL